MTARVSVTVIVYNDADRLPRAVRSVMNQSMADIDIVIADDCSTDNSLAVAHALAAEDARITVVSREVNSGGCGAPRNLGIAQSDAPFIMFLDSDDELVPHACASLLEAIESADADIAAGLTVRINEGTGRRNPWYPELYERSRVLESIDDDPQQLFDGLSTNKIYRRAFLDRIGLQFREDLHYEDILFIYQAYVQARRIAILAQQVYVWHRAPQSSDLSISLRRHDMTNFRDRLTAHRAIDAFFIEHASPEVQVAKDVRFIKHDLRIYLQDLPLRSEAYREDWLREAAAYIESLRAEAVMQVSPGQRVALAMIERGDMTGVLEAVALLYNGGKVLAPLTRVEGAIVWDPAIGLESAVGGPFDVSDFDLARTALRRGELWSDAEVQMDGRIAQLTGRLANPLAMMPSQVDLALVAQAPGRRATVVELGAHAFVNGRLNWQGELDLGEVAVPSWTAPRIEVHLRATGAGRSHTIRIAGDRRPVYPAVTLVEGPRRVCATPHVTRLRLLTFELDVQGLGGYFEVLRRLRGLGRRVRRHARRLVSGR